MADFTVKQHDQGSVIDVPLEEYDFFAQQWQAIDLTDAESLRFVMRSETAAVVAGSCEASPDADPTAGVARVIFDEDDLDFAGDYRGEVEITWMSGAIETVPNGAVEQQYLAITVLEDMG